MLAGVAERDSGASLPPGLLRALTVRTLRP